MKIQFILSDDILHNTSANIRNSGLIKGLVQNGHKVYVICLRQSSKRDNGIQTRVSGAEISYIIPISSVQEKPSNKHSGKLKRRLVKLYNIFRIYDPNAFIIRRIDRNLLKFPAPDMVISSSDPRSAHLLAVKIINTNNYNCPFVQYWGDPMSNDISASLLMRPFLKKAERSLLNKASLVLYTNQITCDKISKMYGISQRKVRYIPTACDKDIVEPPQGNVINVGYFGEYYSWRRNIIPLVEAVKSNPNFRLTLAGTTDVKGIDTVNVAVYPFMDSEKLKGYQDRMDILVILENKPKKGEECNCIQIPGKVFHYGATNKKILVIEETGLTQKAFGDYRRYKFCDNDVESIQSALADLVDETALSMITPVEDFDPNNVASLLIKYSKI